LASGQLRLPRWDTFLFLLALQLLRLAFLFSLLSLLPALDFLLSLLLLRLAFLHLLLA
jgi:hypothetical protein